MERQITPEIANFTAPVVEQAVPQIVAHPEVMSQPEAEVEVQVEIEAISEIVSETQKEANETVTGETLTTEGEEASSQEQGGNNMLEPGFMTIEAQMAFHAFMETSKNFRKGEKEAEEFSEATNEVMDRLYEMSPGRVLSVFGTLVRIILVLMSEKAFNSTFGVVKEAVTQSGAFEINNKNIRFAS